MCDMFTFSKFIFLQNSSSIFNKYSNVVSKKHHREVTVKQSTAGGAAKNNELKLKYKIFVASQVMHVQQEQWKLLKELDFINVIKVTGTYLGSLFSLSALLTRLSNRSLWRTNTVRSFLLKSEQHFHLFQRIFLLRLHERLLQINAAVLRYFTVQLLWTRAIAVCECTKKIVHDTWL